MSIFVAFSLLVECIFSFGKIILTYPESFQRKQLKLKTIKAKTKNKTKQKNKSEIQINYLVKYVDSNSAFSCFRKMTC